MFSVAGRYRMGALMEATEVNLGSAGYRSLVQPELFGAMATPGEFYSDTLHTIAINTRETEFGSIVEPIPITLKAYNHFQAHGHQTSGYGFPQQQMLSSLITAAPRMPEVEKPSTSTFKICPKKREVKYTPVIAPPKKKWIKEYLEEEPKSPVSVRVVTALPVTPRSNGVVRAVSPLPVAAACPPAPAPAPAPVPPPVPAPGPVLAPAVPVIALEPVATAPPPATLLDFAQEHSRPRTTSNSHGPLPQIPSPPSVGSNGSSSSSGSSANGSVPRAGTREVHNKLEKNRRAHLKECFELLKRQLPSTPDDKKTSNLSILGSALRYIQMLRRKERECEHEMERLAREKIAAQQRLSALKREVSVRAVRPRSIDPITGEKDREETINGGILGIPISISTSPPRTVVTRMDTSPPHTLNLSTKLRTLPIQITPTTSQVVRTSYSTRPNTLTLTTLAPADHSTQNGQTLERGPTSTLSTTLVHPTQTIHLPISQVVGGGGLVVGGALQLLAGAPLRLLHAHAHAHPRAPAHANGVVTSDNGRISKENGIVSSAPVTTTEGVVVGGLAPLVVSQPAHLLHAHAHTHKMMETQMVKGTVAPLTVSAQYLSATTIVKPVVVVSTAGGSHAPHSHAPHSHT